MTKNQMFYNELEKLRISLLDLLDNEDLFHTIPLEWHVVLVDVKNSTQAVKDGMHKKVNLSATGSIVVVLNEIKRSYAKMRVPYFFGGDGVTFIVPDCVLSRVIFVLENYRLHVNEVHDLSLKVGSFPVSDIYKLNLKITIAKLSVNPYLTLPIVLGNGLKYAENIIKASFKGKDPVTTELVNLEGMECRWQEIMPPKSEKKVICFLASCPQEEIQAKVYYQITKKIIEIFGNYNERQPISTPKLLLDLSIDKIRKEMYARLGKYSLAYLMKNWILTIIGKYYFKLFKEGREYLQKVSELSHTIMIDGTLHTVISGTENEANRFISFVNELEKEGKITYGIHITYASIMSCYIEDRKTNHNHFIDGTEGGYTSAAMMYKSKLNISYS